MARLSYDYFLEKVEFIFTLMQWKMPGEKRLEYMYESCMDYEIEEVDKAFKAMQEHERFSFVNLKEYLNKYRSLRLEREAVEQAKLAEEELRRISDRPNQECHMEPRDCGKCPVTQCDLVARDCLRAIEDMVEKRKTSQEVHAELGRKYPGLNFEKYAG